MANTIPYIGSKISLISNSEIRYEGILYTINTQESTIALQSVKTFGTEGRKIPDIPPSSEIYDFIIFRGQDIKDLTVLEGAQGGSSPMQMDPAIMSMNQRPAGGKSSGKGGYTGGGKADQYGGGKGGGKQEKGRDRGWEQPANRGWEQPAKGGGKDDGWGSGKGWGGWGKGGDQWDSGKGRGGYDSGYSKGGKGKDYYGGGKGGQSYKGGKDSYKGGGKNDGKGKGAKGKSAKGDGYVKGKSEGKGKDRGNRSKGGVTASGAPVGELLPEANAQVKTQVADDFDVEAANAKMEKVTDEGDKAKPLSGYNKSSSFFDNISCEATDRAAESERPKVDREKARQYDRDTFGDTRRPPRPVGARRAKGKGKGN